MSGSAATHGAKGAGITIAAQVVTMAINFVGMIVMARLLTPDDYGLLAMVTVLMGIGALIRDFGMGTASLQERTLTQAQASNLFWVNAVLSAGTASLLALSSPIVARMFDDDRLVRLVPVMAIVLLLTGLQTQYQARLARSTRFSMLALATVTSAGVSIVVGVASALSRWGYWALAAQQGAAALWMLGVYVIATRWRPSLPARGVGSAEHLRAGADYGMANVLGYIADNVDTFMIGLTSGPVPLGNYNRAFQLFMQPINAVFGPLTRVIIPTINKASLEGRDPGVMLLRVQTALVGLATWGLLATAVTADWLLPLLIGEQWAAAVPLLQILAVGGVFKALSQINYWAYVASRKSRQLLLSNLVTKPIQIVLVVGAAFLGVEWVAWAYVFGRAISWPVNLVWLARTANQPLRAALINGIRIIASAGIAAALTRAALIALSPLGDISLVLIGFSISTILYLGVFTICPGGMKELRAILRIGSTLRRNQSGGEATSL